MIARFDPELVAVFAGLLGLLFVATAVTAALRRRELAPGVRATVDNAWARIRASEVLPTPRGPAKR